MTGNLSDGAYLWNCEAIDNATLSGNNTYNYTALIDKTNPTLNVSFYDWQTRKI